MPTFRVKEYGKIKSDNDYQISDSSNSDLIIPSKSFDNIWKFILENQSVDKSIENAFSLFTKGGKRVIQTKSYVGLIETKQKDTIEILPKIWKENGETLNLEESKRMFLRMLSTLKNTPFLNLQEASLQTKNDFPILEIFISIYIREVERILLFGLKKDYLPITNNSGFLKGSIQFQNHIRKNLIDRSKFFVRYSNYEESIPQNKIIVSTLNKIFALTSKAKNREDIGKLLNLLYEVGPSLNITADLNKCKNNIRLFKDYEKALKWSEVFLLNKGFTNFSGSDINQALLFPMEIMFESFITHLFKKHSASHQVTAQHFKYFLVSKHLESGKFRLKPDIYAESSNEREHSIVIDTKWKAIDENQPNKNYLISQADMYQLYAYGRKYSQGGTEPRLYLIYPKSDQFTKELASFSYEETDGKFHLNLKAIPFDLTQNYQKQIQNILHEIREEVALPKSKVS